MDDALDDGFESPGFESQLLGRTLGGTYRIEARIGSGGMGAVFVATHLRTSRRYAIKVLLPEVAIRGDAMQRFRREAEAVGALGHANVVAIHDFDVADGWAYLVMDLLEGEDLSARIERAGRLALGDAVTIIEGVAAGLGAAHRRGMVHRDLKPANIFLARQPGAPERAILLDFGLAKSLIDDDGLSKLTATGVVMGTPQYMSPEQASGLPLDERADLYSLATILYEMLAGRVPFSAPTIPALFAKLATDPAPPLNVHRQDLPPALTSVLARALAKVPAERYPDAAQFVAAIRAAAEMPAPALLDISPATAAQPAGSTPVGNAAGSWPRDIDPHGATQATPSHVVRAGAALTPIIDPAPSRSWWPLLLVGLLGAGLLGVGGGGYLYWLQVQETREQLAAIERSLPRGPEPDAVQRVIEEAAMRRLQAPPPLEPEHTQAVTPDVVTPDVVTPDVAADAERARVRARRRANRRAQEAAARESPPAGPPSSPGSSGGPPAQGPPAGVQETVAYMGNRDFQGCIRESHRHPSSAALLGARMSCAIHGNDDVELQRVCAEIRRLYPRHGYNQACDSTMQARGVSPQGP